MKRFFLSTALLICSSSALAAGNTCFGNYCVFGSLNFSDKPIHFYCDVDNNVSEVLFENHNVKITGFNNKKGDTDGQLLLKNNPSAPENDPTRTIVQTNLRKFYFEVTADSDKHSVFKTVDISNVVGGTVNCHIGEGGRAAVYPNQPGGPGF